MEVGEQTLEMFLVDEVKPREFRISTVGDNWLRV